MQIIELSSDSAWTAEPPQRSEFLNLLRISEFFGFQWQNLAEILSLLSEGQFDPIKG